MFQQRHYARYLNFSWFSELADTVGVLVPIQMSKIQMFSVQTYTGRITDTNLT